VEDEGWRLGLITVSGCMPADRRRDGGDQPLRDCRALPCSEWDYLQQAIVTTVQVQPAHQDTAWQRFLQRPPGFLAVARMVDGPP